MVQHPAQTNLKSIQSWEIHHFFERLFQWLVVLVKSIPLVSNWNLCGCNLYSLPFIFSMGLILKIDYLLCSHPLNTRTFTSIRSPLSLLI